MDENQKEYHRLKDMLEENGYFRIKDKINVLLGNQEKILNDTVWAFVKSQKSCLED